MAWWTSCWSHVLRKHCKHWVSCLANIEYENILFIDCWFRIRINYSKLNYFWFGIATSHFCAGLEWSSSASLVCLSHEQRLLTCCCFVLVESCMTDDMPDTKTVTLHQTSFNLPEFRASCEAGYKLTGNESLFSCHKQQWSPHEPRCEPVIADNSPTSSSSFNSSSSATGITIWIIVKEGWWGWGFVWVYHDASSVFGQQFHPLVFENFPIFATKRAKMTVKE